MIRRVRRAARSWLGTAARRVILLTLLALLALSASPAIAFAADYTIRSGDTLSAIARRYHTTTSFLAQANGISNPNLIVVGRRIWVPDNLSQGVAPLRTNAYVFPLANYRWMVARHWGGRIGGADLFGPYGSPVFSIKSGRVVALKYDNPQSGNAIQISGTDGRQYYYSHMVDRPTQRIGQWIATGQRVGALGDTGDAAAPHVHVAIGDRITTGDGDGRAGYGTNFDVTAFLNALLREARSLD
jgi:murein DD-endopeptidase MepM/ murein hydrolase activator NlpD